MDRREFIEVGALTTVASTLGCSREVATAPGIAETELPILEGVNWGKAPCRYCGTGCGVEVGVKDNKIVAVRGGGTNFNGHYYVSQTTHTINAGGFKTSFSLKRGGLESTVARVTA